MVIFQKVVNRMGLLLTQYSTYKCIAENHKLDEKKHHYKENFKKTRVIEALEVGMMWDKSMTTVDGRRILVSQATIDIFRSYQATL